MQDVIRSKEIITRMTVILFIFTLLCCLLINLLIAYSEDCFVPLYCFKGKIYKLLLYTPYNMETVIIPKIEFQKMQRELEMFRNSKLYLCSLHLFAQLAYDDFWYCLGAGVFTPRILSQ